MKVVLRGQNIKLLRTRKQQSVSPPSEVERPSDYPLSLSARMKGKGSVKMTTDEIMTLTRGESWPEF